ncbi:MAG: M1 family metallopeptidase [Bacteroidia bacterium]
MKLKYTQSTFILNALFTSLVFAQSNELPLSKNYREALKKETRSTDGKPGKNYWTNFSDYKMNVEVQPKSATVKGSGVMTYYNNSPDTLRSLNFKLIQNVHVTTAPRNADVDSLYNTSGMQIDKMSINDKQVQWNNAEVNSKENPTNYKLKLEQPLLPKSKVTINAEWHYQLSKTKGDAREDMLDSNSFFIAYWYPRVSVYDDVEGWDRTPHNEQAEFYNGFGNYDVTIKVPANYLVLATGDLKNPNDAYSESVAGRIDEATNNDDINLCVLMDDIKRKTITLPNEFNTWHFTADTVPDFAFGISNHYLMNAASAVVDSVSNRRVLIQTAYDTTATNYRDVCSWAQQALKFLSFDLPGVAFPYSKISVFQGHSFMEYPMMVNDMDDADTADAQSTTLHEIAHTYFPFYMGINETRYGFMDEGWAAFFELTGSTRCYKQKDGEKYWADFYCKYGRGASATPMMVNSYELSDNYNFNCYGKPALAYYTLMNYLGEEKFKTCLHEYINRWHTKHPEPYDFFYTFNNVSKQDLNWFWNNWFFQFNYFDVGIKSVKATGNNYTIILENIGGMAVPVNLKITFADGTTTTLTQKCDVWKNKKSITIQKTFAKKIKQIALENGIYPDVDKENDLFKM